MPINDDDRPNPDELLSRIAAEEEHEQQQTSRGKLKIFFGACAGVGKTYAMLNAGQQAMREGVDVVIGIVETHGREETRRLVEGMKILPPRAINHRGTTITEFDLDAALALKPKLILLDEMAHTNAPGSRHPKRWQDIEELLDADIDVYTTVNVQHLESLNDVVAKITGVWVKETIPDALFDKADEISLIDIPSEELIKRLNEGKVYIAPGAKRRAAQNFFKKSNLIALRELALRRTAERVDAQMDSYKQKTGSQQVWSGADRILVCIGPDTLSGKLVRVAKRTASGLKSPWTALYIENERHYRLSQEAQEAVERTLRLAERMGGRTEIIQGGKAPDEIISYARAHGITKIVVGKSPRARWREIIYGTLADHIIRRSGDIDVYIVTGDAEDHTVEQRPFWQIPGDVRHYLAAPMMTFFCTLAVLPFRNLAEPVNLVMAYLVGIVTVAVQFGRGPSIAATLMSAATFSYLFIEPYNEFKLAELRHWLTFGIILLTGLLIGAQTSRLRLQAIHSRKRERNTALLYDMTRELTANRGKVMLTEIAARHIGEMLECDVAVWIPNSKGELVKIIDDSDPTERTIDHIREEGAANWAYSHKQSAGLGTETLPSAAGYYVPLIGSSGVIGVIGVIAEENTKGLGSDKIDLLETFASLTASAIDRANAAELVEKTIVESESEKLRNILLSSVSHDLRTPLASITSATSTLLLENNKITEEYRGELLRVVHEEAARLARMVTNLLDVSSLETGSVKLNRELYFIEELIGSALMRVEAKLGRRMVNTNIDQGLPLVRMDGLLIEQVLINVLENIADHTPENTTVLITAKIVKPDIHVIISDNGPGIPAGDEERIFDKFYTTEGTNSTHVQALKEGGLGLAICRGIVAAHGGKIWAQNNPEGGAIFTFTLPITKNIETE